MNVMLWIHYNSINCQGPGSLSAHRLWGRTSEWNTLRMTLLTPTCVPTVVNLTEICRDLFYCLSMSGCLSDPPPPPLNLQHDLSIQTECAVKDRSIFILRLSVDCVSVCLVLSFGQVYICLSVCLFVCTCLFVYRRLGRFDRCTNLLFVCL